MSETLYLAENFYFSPWCRGFPLCIEYPAQWAWPESQISPAALRPPLSGMSAVSPQLHGSLRGWTVTFFPAPSPVSPNKVTLVDLPRSLACWPRPAPPGFLFLSLCSSFPRPVHLTPEGQKVKKTPECVNSNSDLKLFLQNFKLCSCLDTFCIKLSSYMLTFCYQFDWIKGCYAAGHLPPLLIQLCCQPQLCISAAFTLQFKGFHTLLQYTNSHLQSFPLLTLVNLNIKKKKQPKETPENN